MSKIKLGVVARDNLSGFEGVAVAYTTYLSNCPRWTLRARGLTKDGKALPLESFDDRRCEFVSNTEISTLPPARPADPVELGDRVRDTLSGAEGVVVSHAIYIDGCSHVWIQPKGLTSEGSPLPQIGVDEKDCEIVERANPRPAAVKTGGPRPEPVR